MSEQEWALLQVAQDEVTAEIIRTLLESEGIPVMAKSNLARTLYPALSNIKIYVPRDSLEVARQIVEGAEVEPEAPEDQ